VLEGVLVCYSSFIPKFLLLTALRMSFSLQLQKEALFKLNPQLRLSLLSKFSYNRIQRAGGGGVLVYVPTPLGRKSEKREHRKSSVSHVASSAEW
jgi:hypothetical protein